MADSKKLHSCLGFVTHEKKKNIWISLSIFYLAFLFLAPFLSKIWGVIWDGIQKSNFFGCNGSCSPMTWHVALPKGTSQIIWKIRSPSHFQYRSQRGCVSPDSRDESLLAMVQEEWCRALLPPKIWPGCFVFASRGT